MEKVDARATLQVPANSLSDAQKSDMIARITDVVVDIEGFPAVRPNVFVLIEEIPAGGWGKGGSVLDVEKTKAALAAAARPYHP